MIFHFSLKFMLLRQVYKPSSVLDDHLSIFSVTEKFKRLHGNRRAAVLSVPLSILLRTGFTGLQCRHSSRWALTSPFHPYRQKSAGGISLLHFPWSRLHRTLSGALLCGARTFLVFSPRSSGLLKTNKLFDIYNTAAVFTLAITVFHRIGNRKGRHFHMTSAAAAVLDWRGRHNFIFL